VNDDHSKDDRLTLELLEAIESRSDVSQRRLAKHLGIALGLTNSYLKRCAKKGLVKVKEVPANRYLYYLTPKGFSEKSRLTAQFLATSLTFYRQAAESCSELFELCEARQWNEIVLCGVSDLAEIAYLRSGATSLRIRSIYDPDERATSSIPIPVKSDWAAVKGADAFMITDLYDPLGRCNDVSEKVAEPERVLVPGVLRLEAAIKGR